MPGSTICQGMDTIHLTCIMDDCREYIINMEIIMDGYKIKEHDFFEVYPIHELLVLIDRVY